MTDYARDDIAKREPAEAHSEAELDRILLQQALLDFEVANGRVIDLTKRLVEAHQELLELRAARVTLDRELSGARQSYAELAHQHEEILESRTYLWASKLRVLRRMRGA
jgi:hypothetical protein